MIARFRGGGSGSGSPQSAVCSLQHFVLAQCIACNMSKRSEDPDRSVGATCNLQPATLPQRCESCNLFINLCNTFTALYP